MNKLYKADKWLPEFLDFEMTDEYILAINKVYSEQVTALVEELTPVPEGFKLGHYDSLFIYSETSGVYHCYEILSVHWD